MPNSLLLRYVPSHELNTVKYFSFHIYLLRVQFYCVSLRHYFCLK
jgi:hypothetical protein